MIFLTLFECLLSDSRLLYLYQPCFLHKSSIKVIDKECVYHQQDHYILATPGFPDSQFR